MNSKLLWHQASSVWSRKRIQKAATPVGMSGFITIDMRKHQVERTKQRPGAGEQNQNPAMAIWGLLE
jgi:hypothetical protein